MQTLNVKELRQLLTVYKDDDVVVIDSELGNVYPRLIGDIGSGYFVEDEDGSNSGDLYLEELHDWHIKLGYNEDSGHLHKPVDGKSTGGHKCLILS